MCTIFLTEQKPHWYQQSRRNHRRFTGRCQATRVTAIFAVTLAVLQENIECSRSHQTETFIANNTWLAHVRTASEVTPNTIHCKNKLIRFVVMNQLTHHILTYYYLSKCYTFLANFPAHSRSDAWQVLQVGLLFAIGNRKGAIVKWVCAFWIGIGTTIPAFYAQNCRRNELWKRTVAMEIVIV